MKKILAVILVLVMVFGFAACSFDTYSGYYIQDVYSFGNILAKHRLLPDKIVYLQNIEGSLAYKEIEKTGIKSISEIAALEGSEAAVYRCNDFSTSKQPKAQGPAITMRYYFNDMTRSEVNAIARLYYKTLLQEENVYGYGEDFYEPYYSCGSFIRRPSDLETVINIGVQETASVPYIEVFVAQIDYYQYPDAD